MRYILVFILFFGPGISIYAGVVDTVKLNGVNYFVPSYKTVDTYDSIVINDPFSSLAELLTDQSVVQINNEGGKGSLKTISIRGLSSSHTNVTWNGLNLNSLTLGLQNLGGIPSGVSNEVSLVQGNGASSINSVSIGGTLVLNDQLSWNKKLSARAGAEMGSFGFFANHSEIAFSKNKFTGQIKFLRQGAKNNYEYINYKKIGQPTEIQEHAENLNNNMLITLGYRFPKRNFLIVNHSWLGTNYAEIPKAYNTNSASTALTNDSVLRSVLILKGAIKKVRLSFSSGINHQRYLYEDVTNGISTNYQLTNTQNSLQANYKYKKIKFQSFLELQNQVAVNNQYDKTEKRNIGMVKIHIEKPWFKKKLTTFGTAVLNIVPGDSVVPVGLLGYNLKLKEFDFKAGFGNHFRLPSFNDMFWPNGGNEDLKPELGWSAEQAVSYTKSIKSFKFKIGGEAYYSIVSNWIQWKIESSSSHVENVRKVNAYGSNSFFTASLEKAVNVSLTSRYSYTKTVTLESEISNDPWLGKQNIYVPIHKNINQLKLSWKGFSSVLEGNYFGRRYLSADNEISQSIDPYFIYNFRLNKTWKRGITKLQSRFSVLNITNLSYQGVSNRPMPGRAYYLTFILNFN